MLSRTMLKVHAVLLALSLMVSRGKCTSSSYQDALDYSVFLTSLEADGLMVIFRVVSCALYMTDLMPSRARILATNKQK